MKISDQNERDSGLSQGGQMTNLDLQKHMVFHIWYIALTFSQVNYPAIAFTSSQLINLQVSKYGSFRGVSSTIISHCTDSLQTHGNSWKFPSTLTAVVGGRGILFPWFGVLFRSKYGKISEYSYGGLIRSIELTSGLHQHRIR